MKKILVPCDFSEPAQEAYKFALTIAEQANAEVLVLKAIDIPFIYETSFNGSPYYFDPSLLTELEEDAKRNFEKMKSENTKGDRVSFYVLKGPVTPTIRNFIDEQGVDLVVMGTHGASGITEYIIGSNTEKIVRLSPVPVLAIRQAVPLTSIKNIAFPTTLQLDQLELITRIKELQSFFNATLHLLLVNTPANMRRSKEEMEQMEEYARHYKLKDYTLNIRNDFYEQDGIMNFSHEIKADLIVMATHGRRGLAHLFLGSITEDVVNHVSCPIWTYSTRRKEHAKVAKEEASFSNA